MCLGRMDNHIRQVTQQTPIAPLRCSTPNLRPRRWPCMPIGIILSPGEAHDSTAYADLMEERDSDPGILLADRGYDSDAIRQDARDRGTIPEIPTKKNRRIQHSVDRPLYALRNRIERGFNKLKNSRRIATRYDQTANSFLGFTLLVSIRLWFRFVHAA